MELLQKLLNSYGVSGDEGEIRDLVQKEIKKYVDETYIDKVGNLIAHKKGTAPRIMLAAHMDEIGLIVKRINQKGKIVFSTIGGIDISTLIGQRVVVQGDKKEAVGVITLDALSSGDPVKELPKITDLFIDTGLDKEQLAKSGIKIGNYIRFYGNDCCFAGNGEFICGKALDNRVGCYVLIELAKLLQKEKHDIYYVFTVEEEVSSYGATTSAYSISPVWAIVIDTTTTDDVYSTPTRSLGGGPCITIKDATTIGNKCVNKWLEDTAKKNNIPIQYDVSEYGATDALTISVSRGGIPTTAVSVPVRNIHTVIGMSDTNDIKNTIKLLQLALRKPPKVCLV
ncbi:MAG: M42 family peptidase [Candidatus Aenigmarchaeota archaeon]|nr:M42 family peptidase [Candidatus Aenigmarchaeota archaeon]